MIWYISFEIMLLLSLFLGKKYGKPLLLFTLFMIVLFLSLKDGHYYDLENYKAMFESADIHNISLYPEISYIVISYFLKMIDLNFYVLSFIYYSLTIASLYKAISLTSKEPAFSFFIFLTMPIFFLSNYIAMRQSVAISLFLLAVVLYYKKQKKFILFFILSMLFHYSAIIAFFIFLILSKTKIIKQEFNKSFIFFTVLLSFIFGLVFTKYIFEIIRNILSYFPIVNTFVIHLLKDEADNKILRNLIYICFFGFVLFLYYLYSSRTKVNQLNTIFLNMFTIGLIISFLGAGDMNINRFANYFMISIVILLPNLIFSGIGKLIKYEYILYLLIIVYFTTAYYIYGILKIKDVFLETKFLIFQLMN